ncbi:MAG: 2Fe-2S iron-sulfur cluster binding domain-containing protein [Desulfobacterales bacterium]|nr:2Fe-2S iron-sulfur cluster binding domain-containing protein [Desulfobacterales bacterium]
MVTINIDGRELKASVGTTVMEAARDANIHIPNLCSNEELTPYGACRLCMVEITHGKRTRLVASCIYEVAEGLEVKTDTERVMNVRKLVIELLLSRNPKHPTLLGIAESLGVEETRFEVDFKGCILCGQCVRTCREVVGVSAIGFESRGTTKKVATPFNDAPQDCIACGSCAHICPVGVIPLKEKQGVRTIWKTDFPLQKCEKCGRYFAPVKQLEYFHKIADLPEDRFTNCIHCR